MIWVLPELHLNSDCQIPWSRNFHLSLRKWVQDSVFFPPLLTLLVVVKVPEYLKTFNLLVLSPFCCHQNLSWALVYATHLKPFRWLEMKLSGTTGTVFLFSESKIITGWSLNVNWLADISGPTLYNYLMILGTFCHTCWHLINTMIGTSYNYVTNSYIIKNTLNDFYSVSFYTS